MKAYQVEFRQKIIDVYFNEKISMEQVAIRFAVARSFVQKIIKQWRETGDLSPRKPSGGQPLKLSQSQIIMVGDWVNEKNDITLEKIQQKLKEEDDTEISLSTICRVLQSLDLSRKKKHSMLVNVIWNSI